MLIIAAVVGIILVKAETIIPIPKIDTPPLIDGHLNDADLRILFSNTIPERIFLEILIELD